MTTLLESELHCVGMMHECILGESLGRAALMHVDGKGHTCSTLKRYAVLKGAKSYLWAFDRREALIREMSAAMERSYTEVSWGA